MYRWVGALLKNAGAETLHGVLVSPAAPSAVIAAASAAAGEPSEGGGSAAAPGAAPLTTFEVSLLDELVRLRSRGKNTLLVPPNTPCLPLPPSPLATRFFAHSLRGAASFKTSARRSHASATCSGGC